MERLIGESNFLLFAEVLIYLIIFGFLLILKFGKKQDVTNRILDSFQQEDNEITKFYVEKVENIDGKTYITLDPVNKTPYVNNNKVESLENKETLEIASDANIEVINSTFQGMEKIDPKIFTSRFYEETNEYNLRTIPYVVKVQNNMIAHLQQF